jgi:hypothetical protein
MTHRQSKVNENNINLESEQDNIMEDMTIFKQINHPNFLKTPQKPKRKLTEDNFSFIKRGMSYAEITDIIGPADGMDGFGMLSPYYFFDKGRVTLSFKGTLNYVSCVDIYFENGTCKQIDL